MKWRSLSSVLCVSCLIAVPAIAEDESGWGEGDGVEEPAKKKDAELEWSRFSVGLSGRYGPMSGASGGWGDILLAFRTEFADPVDIRFELGGGYGHPVANNQIPLGTLTSSGTASNDESMDILSGLLRVALEIPQDPLRLRVGPAVGAGVGTFTSTACDEVGKVSWNRAIFGGGIDAVVALGDPVFLEPFVRFDVLYLPIPECTAGDPVSELSPTFQDPVVRYNSDVNLFVGAGLMLGF